MFVQLSFIKGADIFITVPVIFRVCVIKICLFQEKPNISDSCVYELIDQINDQLSTTKLKSIFREYSEDLSYSFYLQQHLVPLES